MGPRPVFTATHPRACSTAFERVFMTRRDRIQAIHEPFGDAFYYGPELLSDRFKSQPEAIQASGLSNTTYRDVVDQLRASAKEGKQGFIKDMAYYLMAPDGKETKVAPSLATSQEAGNPTVLPLEVLKEFNFAFLIRHPRRSIPSFWRCTVPPLDKVTGFDHFMPNEAGYAELVRLFDFLIEKGVVDKSQITVLDADDMLDNPEDTIREFCRKAGIDFSADMLEWNEDDQKHAAAHFEKWPGFHDDAIDSSNLRARTHAQKSSTVESDNEEWKEKYGEEAQKIIRECVDANIPHYEYLNQFALRV